MLGGKIPFVESADPLSMFTSEIENSIVVFRSQVSKRIVAHSEPCKLVRLIENVPSERSVARPRRRRMRLPRQNVGSEQIIVNIEEVIVWVLLCFRRDRPDIKLNITVCSGQGPHTNIGQFKFDGVYFIFECNNSHPLAGFNFPFKGKVGFFLLRGLC